MFFFFDSYDKWPLFAHYHLCNSTFIVCHFRVLNINHYFSALFIQDELFYIAENRKAPTAETCSVLFGSLCGPLTSEVHNWTIQIRAPSMSRAHVDDQHERVSARLCFVVVVWYVFLLCFVGMSNVCGNVLSFVVYAVPTVFMPSKADAEKKRSTLS